MSDTKRPPWYSPLLSLRWRLAFVYSVLFGIFVAILSVFIYYSSSNLLMHNAQANFSQRAQELRTLLIEEVCSGSSTPTLASFAQQNALNDIDEIYLLDIHGKVLASSHDKLLHQPFPYINLAFFSRPPTPTTRIQTFQKHISDTEISDGQLLPLQAPAHCTIPQRLPGYMAVLTYYAGEQSTLRNILLMLDAASALMILAGALIISFFTGIMLSPLKKVTQATQALAQGDLQQRVPLSHGADEIGTLAVSFNQMAKRIEQMFAAQQASERRSRRFVSDASHELRTPITSLRGFTEVLIRGAKDDPATAQRVLGLMKNEAERMTELVNDLLTLARLDEGHFPTPEDTDLVAVAVECLQKASKHAPDNCKLTLELVTHERLRIYASSEPVQQMLLVLLTNAIKYGCIGEQKKVLLRLDKKAGHALAQVIDYGAGIVSDDLPHIFDRFYRGENAYHATSTPIPGTGLGLPIALAIASAYQGTLTVCSEPDQETVFTASFLCKD